MKWFLEKISNNTLPIYFNNNEKKLYPEDFKKILSKKIIKTSGYLEIVDCEFCDDENTHQSQIRRKDKKNFYICENGNGTKYCKDEELAIFEYDNKKLLETITEELSISIDRGSHKDEAFYSNGTFFRIGLYEDKSKKIKVEVFYLRNSEDAEASIRFNELGNSPKMLITNIMRADLAIKDKQNLFTCVLLEILNAKSKDKIFDKKLFEQCFDEIRRVRFDKKEGHLFLDNKRIFTASLKSPHYYFLKYLWDNWMQQKTYSEIKTFIINENKKEKHKDESAQKFCQKIKSEIKKNCKEIDEIITTPTTGHYMIADPI